MQEVLLDSLSRILAYFSLQGSFSAKEEAILRQLLRELGVEPRQEIQRIQQYTARAGELQPALLLRSAAQQLPRPQRYLLYAFVLQLAHADKKFHPEEQRFLEDMAKYFDIPKEEEVLLHIFAQTSKVRFIDSPHILIAGPSDKDKAPSVRHIELSLPGYVAFLYLPTVELILMRLVGPQMEAHLNGQWIHGDVIRVFPEGALLRLRGYTLTYKEVLEQFRPAPFQQRLLWEVRRLSYKFSKDRVAIHPVSFEVPQGRLVGLMGPSGAGKSTLLRLLNGQLRPSSGRVYLNGQDIHAEARRIQGLLGYVPQEDLLIEELTVRENVYYAARLAYPIDEEAHRATEKTLSQLGLLPIADLQVGSPLRPIISGGQRKRVNIALELVRQPLVLFIDEPTSGLSSSDALQVVELLQALAREGRIVFFTLHQPSSDIYKKLDLLLFLDEGGYTIYWGSPIGALQHFRRAAGLSDSEQVECPSCRRVEPESLFDIIQQRQLDELGNPLPGRHLSPERWYQIFWRQYSPPKTQIEVPVLSPKPATSWLRQFFVLLGREGLRKWRTHLATLMLILAAPALGLIVGGLLRYHPEGQPYTLYENDNFPTLLFTNLLAVLFLGMLSPAEELLRDRKIRLREAFLHLSWFSYLHAKLVWVFLITTLQVTLYWGVVSLVCQVHALWVETWSLLLLTSFLSNLLALNLSDAFTHPVPVYILIPILLIPQIVLSGAVVPFDRFNPALRGERPVPLLADFTFTRWAYESQVVLHFTRNPYERFLYPLKARQSFLRYHLLYLLPAVRGHGDTLSYLQRWAGQAPSLDSLEALLKRELRELSTRLLALEAKLPAAWRLRYHNDALEKTALATQNPQKLRRVRDTWIRLYEPAYLLEPESGYTPLFAAYKRLGQTPWFTPVYDALILALMGTGLWLLLVVRALNNLFLGGKP